MKISIAIVFGFVDDFFQLVWREVFTSGIDRDDFLFSQFFIHLSCSFCSDCGCFDLSNFFVFFFFFFRFCLLSFFSNFCLSWSFFCRDWFCYGRCRSNFNFWCFGSCYWSSWSSVFCCWSSLEFFFTRWWSDFSSGLDSRLIFCWSRYDSVSSNSLSLKGKADQYRSCSDCIFTNREALFIFWFH